ncbi:MAG: hypothetical protein A2736_01150 [Candidatus Yanofskybacteria bacterium RIFCSPHIGHO2_01_FULL_41_27]|uniref:Uncharacterized protein n=1 Tax=Candidatus Yanofskybacteria bacterium RIFCSPHIGHO2_01_FULL_41_27 TaxID=1802662 RepID=A0A1F8EER6_9BACT|nr:MAG: hypothetical protein A2736_01150 [Candidatus Yanofskybacteria bacterium RIFCSPHIGHO2_01_FULL_41_27]OGN10197.1 MAG: hypothetical protein A3C64_00690 [Candidatus Yanofskybacteria bacterium RIFCSPHIGHO2_02_FULL_41_12]OGN21413.1 MAG: hypothetical protein A3B00_00335 [Candidatus Yanofskybacteria bacterium RIFCSPLOWO2_01_FULL_41_33]
MAKQVVGGVSGATLGMLADLILKLKSGGITECELERFTNRQNPFGTVENHLAEWERFYFEVFGINANFSRIKIPAKRQGFNLLVIVLEGMTPQQLFDKCKERFKTWKYTDQSLDEIVNSERTAKDGSYAVWFRDRVEADEELKNKSADNLKKAGISGITPEERLLLELFYHWKTGKHLDILNWTLCSGSRYSVGGVPIVGWHGGYDRLSVGWCNAGSRDDEELRSRQAVSL